MTIRTKKAVEDLYDLCLDLYEKDAIFLGDYGVDGFFANSFGTANKILYDLLFVDDWVVADEEERKEVKAVISAAFRRALDFGLDQFLEALKSCNIILED